MTDPHATQRRTVDTVLAVSVAGFIVLLLPMSAFRNINWDEFYFLSHVHAWLNDRLDRPMQTFFVHGFGWLAQIPGHEIGQIVAARLVMVAFLALTCRAIWRMGIHLADRRAAMFGVLAFLSSGFVLPHGTSFRADPIATGLLMTALSILLTSRMRTAQILNVALLSALALLVTVKSALYLPAFLGVLFFRRKEDTMPLRILVAGGLSIGVAAGLYLWHSAGLSVAAGNETGANLREAAGTTLLSGTLIPRRDEILLWALLSLPALFLVGMGFIEARPKRLIILATAFALPLLCLAVYRNAFPYFFPFISAPLMVTAALGATRMRNSPRLPMLLVAMIASGACQGLLALSEGNAAQRATLAEVHRLFPEPVAYIDQHGMVAEFPRQGFFMSTWGIESYRKTGEPVFAAIIAKAQPPLLLANRWELAQAVTDGNSRPGALLPEDQAVLKNSYVHYAGAIWLAGRELSGAGSAASFTVPFPGRYRLLADATVLIDGTSVAPGATLVLDGNPHTLQAAAGLPVRLIWATSGEATKPPSLPDSGLYSGFWTL
ncbi:MAG: hypothetical protein J0L76_03990 [Rhodobacterales bacterium]|nr:hypothetical protein [Rhodobacterales bacterium]